jgi:hypothetical protein
MYIKGDKPSIPPQLGRNHPGEMWYLHLGVIAWHLCAGEGAPLPVLTKLGDSYFYQVGRLASPVSYETFGLSIPLGVPSDYVKDIEFKLRSYFLAVDRIFRKEGNLTEEEREAAKDNIKKAIQPGINDVKHAATAWERVHDLAERETRSAIVALASVLGGIVAVGSTLLTHFEVVNMANKVKRQGGQVLKLRRDLGEFSSSMNELKRVVARREAEEALIREITLELGRVAEHVESLITGYYMLIQNMLHPAIVPAEVLANLVARAKKAMTAKEMEMVLDVRTHLGSMPMSWAVGRWEILILLHVPMIRKSTKVMSLYKTKGGVLEQGQKLWKLKTEEPFLATEKSMQLHQILTADELADCPKVEDVHLCASGAVFRKKVDTCTAALFFGDSGKAAGLCKQEEIKLEENALALNDTAFLLKGSEGVQIHCPRGVPQVQDITILTKVVLPRQCFMTSASFLLVPPLGEHKEIMRVQHVIEDEMAFRMKENGNGSEEMDLAWLQREFEEIMSVGHHDDVGPNENGDEDDWGPLEQVEEHWWRYR